MKLAPVNRCQVTGWSHTESLYTLANTLEKRLMITIHEARKHHDNGRIKPGQFYFNITGKRDIEYYTKQARNAGMSVGDFLSACVTD